MKKQTSIWLVLVSTIICFPAQSSAQEEAKTEAYSSFSRSREGITTETKRVRLRIPTANGSYDEHSFDLWKKDVELVAGKRPDRHFEYYLAEVAPFQLKDMETIRSIYHLKMQGEILRVLQKNDGQLSQLDKTQLIGKLKDILSESEKKESDILLPIQKAFISQYRIRKNFEHAPASALAGEQIAADLGLDQNQIIKLRKAIQDYQDDFDELNKDTEERIKEEKDSQQKKILGIMNPSQRARLIELLGQKN